MASEFSGTVSIDYYEVPHLTLCIDDSLDSQRAAGMMTDSGLAYSQLHTPGENTGNPLVVRRDPAETKRYRGLGAIASFIAAQSPRTYFD